MDLNIRRAEEADSDDLTAISFASKGHWNYPEEYFDIWNKELTITPDYIRQNGVFLAEAEGVSVGYASIVEVKDDIRINQVVIPRGFWLEHLFVKPEFIGRRIGMQLITFLKRWCGGEGIERLHIFSDPHARGFYEKVGARYIGEVPSSVAGRTVPFYVLQI
ncbi:acetyltransferase (GNAT) family protein [Peptococcaceae bacterium CEB3]|nr:acetyltransferase (GNAT) family protein [Peptococcaceae bacterium CEB3]